MARRRFPLRRRRPYTIVSVGTMFGIASPPLTFLRFRTLKAAQRWIDSRPPGVLTRWEAVKVDED